MKRWLVDNGEYKLKLYYRTLEECKKSNPGCEIEECNDYEYLKLVEELTSVAEEKGKDFKGRTVYKMNTGVGSVLFKVLEEDDLKLDCIYYQVWNNERFINPITWTLCDVEEFYNTFKERNPISFEVHTFRKYGEPKMKKPKELNGIKESFSVDFIPKKCKCQCFVLGNDLWIKHRDFFSEEMQYDKEDFGTPLEYRTNKYLGKEKKGKFVYNDCWGSIINRNEAWIVFKNLIDKKELIGNSSLMAREMLKAFSEYHEVEDTYFCGGDWEYFFERICKEKKIFKKSVDK